MNALLRSLLVRLEHLLALMVGPEAAEAILGDVLEANGGAPIASGSNLLGPLAEMLRSVPLLIAAWVETTFRRREVDMDKWNASVRRAAAIVGLLACLPALLLVTGGILQMVFGTPEMLAWLDRGIYNEQIPFVHFLRQPAVVLGGLLVAGALNLLPLVRLDLSRQDGSLVGTVSVRMRSAHLAVGSAAALLALVIVGYAFTENYVVAPRSAAGQAMIPVMITDGKSEWRSDMRVYVPRRVSCQPGWTLVPVALAEENVLEVQAVRVLRLESWSLDCPWTPVSP